MVLKWGIIGLGKIANKFAEDLLLMKNCKLIAVASRSIENAERFALKHKADHFYSSYEELYQNDEVDIVYVATPHNSHMLHSLNALNSGKHVLCEKPLAVNRSQVQRLIDASKANNKFLMEAFWSRFNPSIEAVLEHVENGDIGEVNYINADFTFYRDDTPESRLFNLELAGGSLLDVGVYPIFLSYLMLGYPEKILAAANKHQTGADIQMAAILKYKDGIANVMSGFRSDSDRVARIHGTGGNIYINKIWHEAQGYRLEKDGETRSISLPTAGRGFTYEIEECFRCIGEGRIESKKWSHHDSLNLITICDEIRKQIDLKYPFEE